MRAAIIVAFVAGCFASPPSHVYSADPKAELGSPAIRAILIDRAARDLACDPGAVVVVAFALPKQVVADGSGVKYSFGLAVVEGNGTRITYAVVPTKFSDGGWILEDDDLVMIAHIPIIASAPATSPSTGSDTGSDDH
jgi:hypothetical protein